MNHASRLVNRCFAKLVHEASHILDTRVAGIRHRKAHKKLLAHPDLEQCLQAVA